MKESKYTYRSIFYSSAIFLLLVLIVSCENNENIFNLRPFANNNGQVPTMAEYSGPLFELNHNYPKTQPEAPVDPPWIAVLDGGTMDQENAEAYVNALKDFISEDMRTLIFDYENWNAEDRGWFNQPWLGPIRESIHGMFLGTDTPKELFDGTGLTVDLLDYVLVYYDNLGGFTVGQVWGETALVPQLQNNEAQFPEYTIIIKAAFSVLTSEEWPVLERSAVWPLYIVLPDSETGEPEVVNALMLQWDIIVKDSQGAPDTNWVYSTLVYDKDAPGEDAWDKMVPLGAMWGNDPDVNSAEDPDAPLAQTWINPDAPFYSTTQLGWGGRLSGPNDGAVVAPAEINGEMVDEIAASSCLSCHSVAAYMQESFLLPGPSDPPNTDIPTIEDGALVLFEPGSEDWFDWFQSRPGNVPKDMGTIPLDYDLVFSFKALPAWEAAISAIEDTRERPYHGIEVIMP